MRKLHVVGFTSDLDGLIFSTRKGSKSGGFVVQITDELLEKLAEAERLRDGDEGAAGPAVGERQVRQERDATRARPQSELTPREIQARLRAGRTIDEVAREARSTREWVERFAAPILAEQAQVVELARSFTYSKARLGESALPLGESVLLNLADRGVLLAADEFDQAWNAFQLHDGVWLVRLHYRSRGRPHQASWEVDLATRRVSSRDRLASDLGYVDAARGRRAAEVLAEPVAEAVPEATAARPRRSTARRPAAKRPAAGAARAGRGRASSTRAAPARRAPTPRAAKTTSASRASASGRATRAGGAGRPSTRRTPGTAVGASSGATTEGSTGRATAPARARRPARSGADSAARATTAATTAPVTPDGATAESAGTAPGTRARRAAKRPTAPTQAAPATRRPAAKRTGRSTPAEGATASPTPAPATRRAPAKRTSRSARASGATSSAPVKGPPGATAKRAGRRTVTKGATGATPAAPRRSRAAKVAAPGPEATAAEEGAGPTLVPPPRRKKTAGSETVKPEPPRGGSGGAVLRTQTRPPSPPPAPEPPPAAEAEPEPPEPRRGRGSRLLASRPAGPRFGTDGTVLSRRSSGREATGPRRSVRREASQVASSATPAPPPRPTPPPPSRSGNGAPAPDVPPLSERLRRVVPTPLIPPGPPRPVSVELEPDVEDEEPAEPPRVRASILGERPSASSDRRSSGPVALGGPDDRLDDDEGDEGDGDSRSGDSDTDAEAFVIRPRISAKQASELTFPEERPSWRSRLRRSGPDLGPSGISALKS